MREEGDFEEEEEKKAANTTRQQKRCCNRRTPIHLEERPKKRREWKNSGIRGICALGTIVVGYRAIYSIYLYIKFCWLSLVQILKGNNATDSSVTASRSLITPSFSSDALLYTHIPTYIYIYLHIYTYTYMVYQERDSNNGFSVKMGSYKHVCTSSYSTYINI